MDRTPIVKTCTTEKTRTLFFSLAKERSKLIASGGAADDKTLAKILNVSENDIAKISAHNTQSVDLDDVSFSQNKTQKTIEENDCRRKFEQICESIKDSLDEKYKVVFSRRIEKPDKDTFKSIADDMGVERQRIQQMEKVLIAKLSRAIKFNKISKQEVEMALYSR
jgi:DNA-directed RNA polymerase sigma subunit (sigma70/sigma32)